MPDIGLPELVIILGILVLLFGAGRVAELGGALGRAVREFRQAVRAERDEEGSVSMPAADGGDRAWPGFQH